MKIDYLLAAECKLRTQKNLARNEFIEQAIENGEIPPRPEDWAEGLQMYEEIMFESTDARDRYVEYIAPIMQAIKVICDARRKQEG